MTAVFDDAILPMDHFRTLNLKIKRLIVNPWLTEQSIGLISGWRGTGKTWFALSLCDCVTRGLTFGPWTVDNPVPCLYLDGEMPCQDIQDRMNSLSLDGHRDQPFYLYSDAFASNLGLKRAHLASKYWQKEMKRVLLERKVGFAVFDNLASLASGLDENSGRDWDPINRFLLDLRFEGIASLMLHHTGKGGAQRGTSHREDNLDFSIILKRPFDYVAEDGARFVVHFSKSRVPTKDLSSLTDTEFQLREKSNGETVWTYSDAKGQTKKSVLKLFADGMKQSEIASLLGRSAGRVSQVVNEAKRDDLITSKGSLTQTGYRFIADEE